MLSSSSIKIFCLNIVNRYNDCHIHIFASITRSQSPSYFLGCLRHPRKSNSDMYSAGEDVLIFQKVREEWSPTSVEEPCWESRVPLFVSDKIFLYFLVGTETLAFLASAFFEFLLCVFSCCIQISRILSVRVSINFINGRANILQLNDIVLCIRKYCNDPAIRLGK